MRPADAINVERIDSTIEDEVIGQPFIYGALIAKRAPLVVFLLDSIELPDVTPQTSSSHVIELPSADYDYSEISLPDFTTIGHVRIRISEVSRLEPPTIDF